MEERGGRARQPGSGEPPVQRARRRLRLPRRRTALVVSVALVAGGSFGAWALYGSSWLRVERVAVSGTRVLSEERVRTVADIPLGEPMAGVDKDAVADRLTERLRRIASVEVVRSWPDAVAVKVTERRPEVVLEKSSDPGKYVEVDRTGLPYATVVSRPEGVPLLVLEPESSAADRRFGADRLRRAAVEVASALPVAVRRDTGTIRVRSYDSITLELSGGRTVMWGSREGSGAKAEALGALLKARGKAGHFDVSVPSAPAVAGS